VLCALLCALFIAIWWGEEDNPGAAGVELAACIKFF
jgi:hypothetical protein